MVENLAFFVLEYHCRQFDASEKLELVDKLYNDFGIEHKDVFLKFLAKRYGSNVELCDFLTTKLKNNQVNFAEYDINFILPHNKPQGDGDFFISSIHIPAIKNLLNAGFRFNEKAYEYNGDNLFVAVLKSERKDIIETILPTLMDVTPKKGSIEQQNKFIDGLKDTSFYEPIKKQYYMLQLDGELSHKETKEKKLKV